MRGTRPSSGLGDLGADACVRVDVLAVACDGDGLGVVGARTVAKMVVLVGDASFLAMVIGDLAVGAHVMCGMTPRCSGHTA